MNFYIEKLPWGGEDSLHRKPSGENVFYIENLPGELFSMGDAFLYDTCVVDAMMLIVSGVAPFLRFSVSIFSAAWYLIYTLQ